MAPRSRSAAGIGEDDVGDRLAVERAVGCDDAGAEAIDHRDEDVGSRLLELPGDGVGVDDHRTSLGEERGHGGLPGADPAGETDEDHAGGR